MKTFIIAAVAAVLFNCSNAVAQMRVHVSSCSWITISVVDGPDGLPVSVTEIGPGPDGYFLFYSDASESMLLMEGEMAAGQKQGLWKFYSNGVLTEKIEFFNSLRSGLYESYHPSGDLRVKTTYSNNQINGTYTLYDNQGNIVLTKQMMNDIPVGE